MPIGAGFLVENPSMPMFVNFTRNGRIASTLVFLGLNSIFEILKNEVLIFFTLPFEVLIMFAVAISRLHPQLQRLSLLPLSKHVCRLITEYQTCRQFQEVQIAQM